MKADIVWIDGEAFSPNHPKVKRAIKNIAMTLPDDFSVGGSGDGPAPSGKATSLPSRADSPESPHHLLVSGELPPAHAMKTAKQHNAEHLGDYETNCEIPSTKPEQVVCDDAMGSPPGEAPDARCTFVRVAVRSFRMRLLDPDNLVGGAKYFVDGLHYAGIIQGDDPSQITLEVTQQKVATKSEERTEIEIL